MPSPRSPARRRLSATMPRPSKRSTKPWPLTPSLPPYKNSGKPSCSTPLPTRSGRQAFRPEDGQQQADDNSNRHFDETVGGDNPRRLRVRDEHHDGERDAGETERAAVEMKGGGTDTEQENCDAENVEMGTKVAGDQAAGYGAKGCSDEAEAGDGERGAERGLQNDHGGDGGPMGFREFEDAGREEGHSGADGAAGGVFQRLAV